MHWSNPKLIHTIFAKINLKPSFEGNLQPKNQKIKLTSDEELDSSDFSFSRDGAFSGGLSGTLNIAAGVSFSCITGVSFIANLPDSPVQ